MVTTEPLSGLIIGHVHGIKLGNRGKRVAHEQKKATNETQTFNHGIFLAIRLALGQGAVDHMAEIRLEADVQKAKDSEHLIDGGIANLRIKIIGQEIVLDRLQELHGEEEEDARRQFGVAGA